MTSTTTASIKFRAGIGGEPVLQEMRPSIAHSWQTGRWGATLIGDPSHPVAGDHHGLHVAVGVGCCAEIRSSSATVARRGPVGGRALHTVAGAADASLSSSLDARVTVATDAMLTWRLEPGIASQGARHRVDAEIDLAANSRLLWRDDFLVERRGEATPGTWSSRLRVTREGWPVVCTELAVGPASPLWESPAVLEGARVVGLMVVVDPEQGQDGWTAGRATEGTATAAALPLAGPGLQMVAWGDELADCRAAIDRLAGHCGLPAWALGRWQQERALDATA